MSDCPVFLTPIPDGDADWLHELKVRIHNTLQRTALAVNGDREWVLLHRQIGLTDLS